MKKKQWYMMWLVVFMLFMNSFSTHASTETITVTTAGEQTQSLDKVEAAKDSVVQVVIQYVAEDGSKYLLKSGSGFLISDSAILTNYQNIILTDEEKDVASKYVSEQTGKNISFKSEQGSEAAYQVGIAVYRDVVFTATVNPYSSKEMDLAILNITDALNREKATLGNSDEVENGMPVYALGYKQVSVMSSGSAELLSQDDCKEVEGVLCKTMKESQVNYLSHTCEVHKGNTGGPIIDKEGNVLGMNVYTDTENADAANFKALGVNEIKGLLNSCKVPYQEAGLFTEKKELFDVEEQEEEKEEVNTNLLDNYIVSFSMLQQAEYTPESYLNLKTALDKAKEVKNDPEATQEEVDNAVAQLDVAKNGLVIQPKTDWPLIIAIICIAVIVLVVVVILILYMLGIIGHKEERESLKTLQDMTNISRENLAGTSASLRSNSGSMRGNSGSMRGNSGSMRGQSARISKAESNNIVRNVPRGSIGSGANDGTTVLGNAAFGHDEGTTLLGSYSNTRSNAYLTRVKTSEKINLDCGEFVIGKGNSGANYSIMDNPTISREHAKIIKRGSNYFVVDLNSTNSTYLNGRLLHPQEEVELTAGNVICLSDEEFIFQEM